MKIRYLPIDDRNNLRVLRHSTDDTVNEAILCSIFKRPYYTLQVLWEYHKWFLELTPAQLEQHPELAFGLCHILIMAGELERAKQVIATMQPDSYYQVMARLNMPGNTLKTAVELVELMRRNGWTAQGQQLTAGRPGILNGLWDYTPGAERLAENRDAAIEQLNFLFPENGDVIYDIMLAEHLYQKNECYDALVLTVGKIPTLKQRQDMRILFAALTLEVYILVLNGQSTATIPMIHNLREQIIENGLEEYTPNLDALETWAAMYDGDYAYVTKWMREQAPDEYGRFCMLDLFRYMIKMRAYIISGKDMAVTALAQRLLPLLEQGNRFMDLCELHMLWAMSEHSAGRTDSALEHLGCCLALSEKYRYDRLLADEGKRICELLRLYEKRHGADAYCKRVKELAQKTAELHPRYLKKQLPKKPELTETELKVLRFLADGSSNTQISEQTGMAVETAKVHCKHIFDKLEVKNRRQAVFKAIEYGIIEPIQAGAMLSQP